MTTPPLPSVLKLTRAQHSGWACVWCGVRLGRGAVSQGRAAGAMGEHDLSVEVYACSSCAVAPHVPGTRGKANR